MKRVVFGSILVLVASHAWAQPDRKKADDEEEDEEDDEEDDEEEVGKSKPEPKPTAKPEKQEFKKQDLRGHSVDAAAVGNPFQKDRFFVDKVDTEQTEEATLVQGSLQWSNFVYTESSGKFPLQAGEVDYGEAASKYSRYFTDLRLQTDFRHISGSRWDARIDARGRYVADPGGQSTDSADPNHIQSGFNGTNELELREAWIVRSGKRTDLFFGRQFVPDLGAIKIDGLRFDYASSEKLTFVGFGGLYPVRGSRSLTTDYPNLRTSDGTDPLTSAGKVVTSAGFGAAYRTISMHGSLGGVSIVPLSSERPRIYGVANGYYRTSTKLDLYHFAILDVFGAAADPIALTNLSTGINYKPSQRLRLTLSFNRVDTETLNVQAGAFLNQPVVEGNTQVQNEAFIQLKRISTNSGRGSLSVGLGELNRFEISIASAFRYRPEVTLTAADGTTSFTLDPAKGVDIFGSIVDRRSFANLRLGFDYSQSFAVGDVAFSRSTVRTFRGVASREIGKGRGEWEAEISYANTLDRSGGMAGMCSTLTPVDCYGTSAASVLNFGGQVYYRLKDNIFGIGNIYISQMGLDRKTGTMTVSDPKITSVMGFARIAYRF